MLYAQTQNSNKYHLVITTCIFFLSHHLLSMLNSMLHLIHGSLAHASKASSLKLEMSRETAQQEGAEEEDLVLKSLILIEENWESHAEPTSARLNSHRRQLPGAETQASNTARERPSCLRPETRPAQGKV